MKKTGIGYAFRALCRNPGFTAVAVLTLAIGIGANTAAFSVVDGVLLRPLAYPEPDRLVAISQSAPGAAGIAGAAGDLPLSGSMYFTYAEQNHSFQSIGIWVPYAATVTGLAEPEQVRSILVSDGALQALNVKPAIGRWLLSDDQKPGATETAMLSYAYWQKRFGASESAIGRTILVEARPRQIVGVMPRGFRFVSADPDLILPLALDPAKQILPGFSFSCVARLKPGVTLAGANADLARLIPIWMSSWPAAPGIDPKIYRTWGIAPAVRPLRQDVTGKVAGGLWVLMSCIGIVMLIACANVANLLLVRAEARRQELAIRAALGAGWGRIVGELLTESIILGLAGGVAGLALAFAGLRVLIAKGPANLPRLSEISLDGPELLFALAISVLSGLLFGTVPAWRYAGRRIQAELQGILRGGGRSMSQTRQRHRASNALAVCQVALAAVLLIGAGLMIHTFQALRTVEPGFTQAAQLETFRVSIPRSLVQDVNRFAQMQTDIGWKLANIPGVSSVGFESEIPMAGEATDWDAVMVEGKSYATAEIPPVRIFKYVSPGVFRTEGARMIAGRDFTAADQAGRRHLVIISENLAREQWGSAAAAVGQRIRTALPAAAWHQVIGVVQDIHENGLQQVPPAIVYWPVVADGQYGPSGLHLTRNATFVLRAPSAGTEALMEQVRRTVWSVDASLPVASVQTMQEVYDRSLAQTSFTLVMLAISSTMALLLGLIGIYGVISYAVSQRTREMGIRSALGAGPGALRQMFVRQALGLAGTGVLIGLAAAAALSRLMKSILYGTSPMDPITFVAVPVVLILAAVVASYVPARRASGVDPLESLRSD